MFVFLLIKIFKKGTFTEILIKKIYEEKGKIDFILIIGNGLSDEEMFVAAKKNLKYNSERFVMIF